MSSSLETLLALVFHGCGLLAAIHAVSRVRTSQGALGWVLGLIFLPYLTLIPYLFLGSSRFHGYVQMYRLTEERRRAITELWPGRDAYMARYPAPPAHQRFAAIEGMLQLPFHSGHRLRLLVNGQATFEAIFEAIDRAEKIVLVQFFIFADDDLGRRMQQALIARAAAGVRVCVLYDGIGCHALPTSYVEILRAGGVEVHAFATRLWRNRFQVNFRNHRKIVVVDGWRAFVGGHNVSDEYLGLQPPLSPWRDTHMELQGPAVADVQASFMRDWYWVTNNLLPFLPPREGEGTASCLIAATGPADQQETCSLLFVSLINAAQKRIWLTTPYFVPDLAVIDALKLAVFRGVEVRVLIPSRPDHRAVFLASVSHAFQALKAGIQIYQLQPGFIHQKVALIDEDTCMIGSMNLDNRSFRLNFEISALNLDAGFAAEVEAMLVHDFNQSRRLQREDYQRLRGLKRLAMHATRLLEPVL